MPLIRFWIAGYDTLDSFYKKMIAETLRNPRFSQTKSTVVWLANIHKCNTISLRHIECVIKRCVFHQVSGLCLHKRSVAVLSIHSGRIWERMGQLS